VEKEGVEVVEEPVVVPVVEEVPVVVLQQYYVRSFSSSLFNMRFSLFSPLN
jgi:hypothetical protein